jgi:putative membrane protein
MPKPNRIKRGNWIALIAALLVLGAAVVVAKTSRERFSDAHFAVKPAQGSLAEVQLSTARCAKVEVRLCALSAKNGHRSRKSKREVETIAGQENISLLEDLDKDAKQTYEKLSKLSGRDFDRAYAQEMVKDHKKDVAEFKKEASAGKNETIRAFAVDTLPTLQDHLKQAREIKDLSDRSVATVPVPNAPK